MSSFLLRCDCGADIAVTTAQAGGSADCPSCGRSAAVPRLRDLSALPRGGAATSRRPAARRPWTLFHTLLLVGALVGLGCWMVSMSFRPPEMEWVAGDKIRSSVMQASVDEVYTMFRTRLVPAGADRPPTAEEMRMRDRADFYGSIRDGLRIAAAVGAAAAALGGIGLLAGLGGRKAGGAA